MGSGAVGKGQQLKKQRSREASEGWKDRTSEGWKD